jgi:putative sigma-54 modulation protein
MRTTVTSRRFKAHESLVAYAQEAVERLLRYYDGILKSEVILQYEKARNSVKVAEIHLSVYSAVLTAKHRSDDFHKSIDGAVEKIEIQLKKFKDKLHRKDRKQVRRVRAKE